MRDKKELVGIMLDAYGQQIMSEKNLDKAMEAALDALLGELEDTRRSEYKINNDDEPCILKAAELYQQLLDLRK